MTGRLIRFPIADPLETALVAVTELDRYQLEQLQEKVYGPYPYLRLRIGGRQRSIYLKALAHATRASATTDGQISPRA